MTPHQEQSSDSKNYMTLSVPVPRRHYPDGDYGWCIVFLSFLLYLIADGIAYPLGLINSEWLKYFNEGETKTSWIGSIFYATPLLSGPITSKLVERYGCKQMTIIGGAIGSLGFILASMCTSVEQLYITIGLIGGAGLSSAYIVGLLSVERWFEAKRSLAIGIVSAGTGFGTFVFPPITQLCLDTFGWRFTVLGLSGLLMIVSLVGAFHDDPPWKIDEDTVRKAEARVIDGSKENTFIEKLTNYVDFSHFREPNFLLLGITTFIIYAFYNTTIYYIPELLKNFDYTEIQSARFLSVIGFFLMTGMLGLGWVADQKGINVVVLNSVCVLLCGISEALMPFVANSAAALSFLCAVFGFTFASAYVLIPKIAEMIVGVDNFASAIGLNFFMQGLGLLVGAPFSCWIYGIDESWPNSFYVCGGLIALSSILAYFIKTGNKENAE